MLDLKSLAELWHRRASVADAAAEELSRLGDDVIRLISRNDLGVGCAEGEMLHRALRGIVQASRDEFRSIAGVAVDLAEASVSAESAYRQSDAMSAQVLE